MKTIKVTFWTKRKHFTLDSINDIAVWNQFRSECRVFGRIGPAEYEKLLKCAGGYGYEFEVAEKSGN